MEAEFGTLPKVGDYVDHYRIVAVLGRGGMAVVFAVTTVDADGALRHFAMKMMLPHLMVEPYFVRMFLDETRVASRVVHPNVVRVFAVGQWQDTPYLVMEMLWGRNLSVLMQAELPAHVALEILAQASAGLHAAHETLGEDGAPLSLVHRDFSPQNLFVCLNGDVKVLDFGVAAARGRESRTRTGEIRGKLGYLAPEQITRAYDLTRAIDLWALGVVAWEGLSGRRLFAVDGGNEAAAIWNVVEQPIDDLSVHAPSLPESARDVVRRCLDRDPTRRPSTSREVCEVFAAAALEAGGSGPPTIAAYVDARFGDEVARERVRLLEPPTELPERRGDLPAQKVRRPRVSFALLAVAVVATAGAFMIHSRVGAATPQAPSPGQSASTALSTPAESAAPPSIVAAPTIATFTATPDADTAPSAPDKTTRRVPAHAPTRGNKPATQTATSKALMGNPF